jgi:hypothetical protein
MSASRQPTDPLPSTAPFPPSETSGSTTGHTEFLLILIGRDITYSSVPQSELTPNLVYSGYDAAQMMSQLDSVTQTVFHDVLLYCDVILCGITIEHTSNIYLVVHVHCNNSIIKICAFFFLIPDYLIKQL